MKIKEYSRPKDVQEAYEQLMEHENATVLGGCVFLKLQRRTIPFAIDLSNLGLDKIETTPDGFRIGAMTTLRQMETSELLPDALQSCPRQIGGVALRNLATIGGSIMGRYPFSDVMTAMIAMNATLNFYKKGAVPIAHFLHEGLDAPDILLSVSVTNPAGSLFATYKPVYTDFSLVNLSISLDEKYTVSIGATPKRAKAITVESLSDPQAVLKGFTFSDDRRASGAYRRALAKALLEDAFKEAKTWK